MGYSGPTSKAIEASATPEEHGFLETQSARVMAKDARHIDAAMAQVREAVAMQKRSGGSTGEA